MIRIVLGCLAMVAVYFAVPIGWADRFGVRLALSAVGLLLATWLIRREIRREVSLRGLLFAMVTGVLLFALTDYSIAISRPGEFADLNTRIDALYFALSTLGTVGFGDVHAQGQLARAVLCVQILFNVAVLATAGSVLVKRVDLHRSRRAR